MRARIPATFGILVVAFTVATLGAPVAHAQSVTLTTPYPTVDVEAGTSVSFDLTVDTSSRQRVDLAVTDVPDGWTATLRGGGFVIGAVTADPDSPPRVTLDVDVPADASDGSHRLVVTATGASGDLDRLDLDLRVAEEVAGAVTIETDFPRLTGGSEDTFSYDLTLRNDIPEEVTFALQAQGPENWQVEAHPSLEARATTVTVAGGSTATVKVSATPPEGVAAGEYQVGVDAVGGGGQRAHLDLVAEVVGSVQLSLATPDDRLNASGSAGDPTEIALVLRNDGSAPLTGVQLTASPPSGWDVTFEPATVDAVPPGQSVQVTAVVTPADDAVTGDYVVTLRAAGQGRSSSADIRFTVQTSAWWGAVGIVVIVSALGGLGFVFRRFGRR